MNTHWYLGLAPLLGWCLDAVIRTGKWGPLVPSWVSRATARFEFVMRTGLEDRPERAGLILVLWVAGSAWLACWLVGQAAFILTLGQMGRFAAWTVIFFLIIGVRHRASAGIGAEAALLGDQPDAARAWLEHVDSYPPDNDPQTLSRATVQRMSEGVVECALLAIFWGTVGGAALGAAAVAVHEVGRYARRSETAGDALWTGPRHLERWLMVPPSWLAIVAVYAVIPLGGGSRARTMAGYLNHFRLSPGPRIAAAVIQGLALERLEGPDGVTDPIVPEDIQRSVIVLWTATFAGALLCAAFACSAYWLWGTLT